MKITATLLTLTVLALLVLWVQHGIVHWEDASHYNIEAVSDYYDRVELFCLQYESLNDMPHRCTLFLTALDSCSQASGTPHECGFEDFYSMTSRLGFEMPPLYKDGFVPATSWYDMLLTP